MSAHELTIKSLLYLAAATSVHVSLSPPNPPVKKDQAVPNTTFERLIRSISFFGKAQVWLLLAWDLIVSVTTYHLRFTSNSFCLGLIAAFIGEKPSVLWTVHPIMTVATVLTVLAAALRIWCYKTLGTLFTFEISIQRQHTLITSGPYSWVRHPSYTGTFMTFLGLSVMWISPGSWVREFGKRYTVLFSVYYTAWTVGWLYTLYGIFKRVSIEDKALRKEFGTRWDAWAQQTPQALIPYVL